MKKGQKKVWVVCRSSNDGFLINNHFDNEDEAKEYLLNLMTKKSEKENKCHYEIRPALYTNNQHKPFIIL